MNENLRAAAIVLAAVIGIILTSFLVAQLPEGTVLY